MAPAPLQCRRRRQPPLCCASLPPPPCRGSRPCLPPDRSARRQVKGFTRAGKVYKEGGYAFRSTATAVRTQLASTKRRERRRLAGGSGRRRRPSGRCRSASCLLVPRSSSYLLVPRGAAGPPLDAAVSPKSHTPLCRLEVAAAPLDLPIAVPRGLWALVPSKLALPVRRQRHLRGRQQGGIGASGGQKLIERLQREARPTDAPLLPPAPSPAPLPLPCWAAPASAPAAAAPLPSSAAGPR